MICEEALDAMLKTGATAEMIVAVVKAEIQKNEINTADRRRKDALRQRKSRRNRRLSKDVTVTSCDSRDKKEKHPPNEYISNPPEKKNLTPTSPKGDGSPNPKIPLSESWKPPQLILNSKAQRVIDGWPPGKIETECEKFCEYYLSRATKRVDWDASWRSWILKSEEFENGKSLSETNRDIDLAARQLGFGG